MKKLQGTRAGRPIAIAFDTEIMQFGIKLFATDEAILSPDWVTNVAIINAYDMRHGEFFWINRAYATHRKEYQDIMKQAKDAYDPNDCLQSKLDMYYHETVGLFDKIRSRVEFGKLLPFSSDRALEVEKGTAT